MCRVVNDVGVCCIAALAILFDRFLWAFVPSICLWFVILNPNEVRACAHDCFLGVSSLFLECLQHFTLTEIGCFIREITTRAITLALAPGNPIIVYKALLTTTLFLGYIWYFGKYCIPWLFLHCYLIYLSHIYGRYFRWIALPETTQNEILAITVYPSPRPPHVPSDVEWFGESKHFLASILATERSLDVRDRERPRSYDTVTIGMVEYSKMELLNATYRYLTFEETKEGVITMVQAYQVLRMKCDEHLRRQRQELQARVRRELKWKKSLEEDWHKRKRFLDSFWNWWAPPPEEGTRQDRLAAQFEKEPCCICLDEYDGTKYMIQLSCGHVFHEDCMVECILTKATNSCVFCGTKILRSGRHR